ncbi:uncharacterized protein LOC135164112 [Diachasmimorpha longicaudata]|uniref:uncharacterized protein LOC135164112 n=1 Tax=Diachasmimorpha longicaudata TaxID=58733 RepID=UPI0030B8C6FB
MAMIMSKYVRGIESPGRRRGNILEENNFEPPSNPELLDALLSILMTTLEGDLSTEETQEPPGERIKDPDPELSVKPGLISTGIGFDVKSPPSHEVRGKFQLASTETERNFSLNLPRRTE